MTSAPLLLASGSPRRRQLLAEAGVFFEVVTAQVVELDQVSAPELPPGELALTNAQLKARAVAAAHPSRWVLAADTVVALGNRILGKPASKVQAREFLRALSGQTHRVMTGCVLKGPTGDEHSLLDVSEVTFLPLSEETVGRYLEAVEVVDKAGGYALQEKGEWIIAGTQGSRSNIIGLPMEKVLVLLRQHGLAK